MAYKRKNKPIVDFAANIKKETIDKYVIKGVVYVDPVDDSVEKLCKRCNEWWPLTSEFWYTDKDSKLCVHSWCKACYGTIRREREANRDK